ncbi:MAG: YlmC/YmxH family sporulation protein [Ruminococcus sp.]|jgi:YlmC/YmxH family sporulation protein|uniref:YlmC/YmxH family sporulation protein n=1 Tax=Ruminococcus sp. FC2018 TaxID=1410617 RepID=UPI00048CC5C6|nr:YlmC/YmxH family sporulation protein [Ruminococcus sp. FC2018]MBP3793743.1 YlmC/YmxH family sporulation protein [Ruminococcus sp.]MBQ1536209.1 YlmC/YmxH family sporulation protein [Ruminococcus sp.]MBQ4247227.1 YlmC/YmxH family sporulation protein [Ruminococcus sp.]
MICSFSGLRNKEVVDLRSGMKLGFVDDAELDTVSGKIVSLVVYGKPRAFGIMGRDDDIVIKCTDIQLIGEDIILVDFEQKTISTKTKSFLVENLLK